MQLTFQYVLGQKGHVLVIYYEKTTKHEYAKQQKYSLKKQQKDCKNIICQNLCSKTQS
jgi:hypothetical protein